MGKLSQWVKECIEGCRTRGELNASNNGQVLLEKFAEHMDEQGNQGGSSQANFIVTVQVQQQGNDFVFIADRTIQQIIDAYTSGACVTATLFNLNNGFPICLGMVLNMLFDDSEGKYAQFSGIGDYKTINGSPFLRYHEVVFDGDTISYTARHIMLNGESSNNPY